jgi:prefoldin subunit 5
VAAAAPDPLVIELQAQVGALAAQMSALKADIEALKSQATEVKATTQKVVETQSVRDQRERNRRRAEEITRKLLSSLAVED